MTTTQGALSKQVKAECKSVLDSLQQESGRAEDSCLKDVLTDLDELQNRRRL